MCVGVCVVVGCSLKSAALTEVIRTETTLHHGSTGAEQRFSFRTRILPTTHMVPHGFVPLTAHLLTYGLGTYKQLTEAQQLSIQSKIQCENLYRNIHISPAVAQNNRQTQKPKNDKRTKTSQLISLSSAMC